MQNRIGRKVYLIGLVITIALLSGCSGQNTQTDEGGKINIYTSDYVLADISQKIGGENVDVKNIIPPGVNSHDYEPSAREMAALTEADIFIYNGAGIETWLQKIIANLEGDDVTLLNASHGISLIEGTSHEDDEEEHEGEEDSHGDESFDSHVWMNPLNALHQAENVKNSLVELDQENAAYYEENFANLRKQYIELDEKFENELADTKRKEFFVSHSIFGYLAERYGLEEHSIAGIIPSDEPSPAEMAQIIKDAKELNIKYILVDPMDSQKISQVVASEIGAKVVNINTIASLTEEELSKGLDYFNLMEQNLEVLKQALNE